MAAKYFEHMLRNQSRLCVYALVFLQCFDAVSWTAGRASGL